MVAEVRHGVRPFSSDVLERVSNNVLTVDRMFSARVSAGSGLSIDNRLLSAPASNDNVCCSRAEARQTDLTSLPVRVQPRYLPPPRRPSD